MTGEYSTADDKNRKPFVVPDDQMSAWQLAHQQMRIHTAVQTKPSTGQQRCRRKLIAFDIAQHTCLKSFNAPGVITGSVARQLYLDQMV